MDFRLSKNELSNEMSLSVNYAPENLLTDETISVKIRSFNFL